MSRLSPIDALAAERPALLEQAAILDAALRDIVQSAGSTTGDDEHDPEGATIAFERANVAALAQGARARLVEVDAALHRVTTGAYGRCLVCGQPIGAERLAARPAAEHCTRCAGGGAGSRQDSSRQNRNSANP